MPSIPRSILVASAVLWAAVAPAAVENATPAGFHIRHTASVTLAPGEAYRRLLEIGRWWSSEHSYSGDARNLSLRVRPDGCFCEKLPDGGFVVHMRIGYARPGETLRLIGGLGPLQELGVYGALTFSFKATGTGTVLQVDYRASGADGSRLDQLAPVVDAVLGEQVKRYAAYADSVRSPQPGAR